jgi:hypothetical protein
MVVPVQGGYVDETRDHHSSSLPSPESSSAVQLARANRVGLVLVDIWNPVPDLARGQHARAVALDVHAVAVVSNRVAHAVATLRFACCLAILADSLAAFATAHGNASTPDREDVRVSAPRRV